MRYFPDDDDFEYSDGRAAIGDALSKAFSQKKPKPKPLTPRDKAGYVYLLEVPNHPGLYKIGRASNPDNRLRTFNVKLPFPVSYAHLIKSNDCYKLERELHQLFSEQRLDGEFFTLSAADVMVIKAMQGD